MASYTESGEERKATEKQGQRCQRVQTQLLYFQLQLVMGCVHCKREPLKKRNDRTKSPEELSWGGESEAVGKHRRKDKREKKMTVKETPVCLLYLPLERGQKEARRQGKSNNLDR